MVVSFQVDACLPYDITSSTNPSDGPTVDKAAREEPSSGSSSDTQDLRIIRVGSSNVPQTHLLEIKTHSIKAGGGLSAKWPRTYPQLYLSQTPHIHHAYHKHGTFIEVRKFRLGQDELVAIDQRAQVGFKKLRQLLGYIKSLVLKYGAMRISLVCVGKTLSVYRIPPGQSCLPEDALALFVA